MDCPVCKKPMIILEFRDVELDFCPSCEGCWLDAGELGLILQGERDLPEDAGSWATSPSRRRCPRCNGKMKCGKAPGTDIEADVCVKRHGMWLDRDELAAIAAARTDNPNAATLGEFCRNVFGQKKAG
jgi:uncharacterized protein